MVLMVMCVSLSVGEWGAGLKTLWLSSRGQFQSIRIPEKLVMLLPNSVADLPGEDAPSVPWLPMILHAMSVFIISFCF